MNTKESNKDSLLSIAAEAAKVAAGAVIFTVTLGITLNLATKAADCINGK